MKLVYLTTNKFKIREAEMVLGDQYGIDIEEYPVGSKIPKNIVDQIQLDGPVYNSGILVGDIITKIDNVEINKMSELRKYIYSKNPGDIVKLTVHRSFKDFEVEVKLNYKL